TNTDNRLDNLLKEKGIITTARVRDGFTVTRRSRRSTSKTATIQVTFKLKDGKLFNTGSEVSEEVFDNLARGQGVDIIYLPTDPSIFKVIIGSENAAKFGGVSNRNLEFTDLDKILSLHVDSVRDYLNTISVYWTTTKEKKDYYYTNESKDEVVARAENGNLLYTNPKLVDVKTFLKDAGVIETYKDTTAGSDGLSTIWITEKYLIKHTLDINVDNPAAGVAGVLAIQRR
ncbi:MAG TPA: hypothetical protein VIN08_11300, partial [Ohtaekwangia sp.]|uniref:hypothetical protein n=1 Tax=Ohtaekwangia sp. TaxID=2066019 RepID=UPI002F952387